MGRIGVSVDTWNSAVSNGASTVSNVKGVTVKELSKTNLNRFKTLIDSEKKIETTLSNYKAYNVSSTNKMKEVAQKIVEEDAQYGADFDAKAANLRFK